MLGRLAAGGLQGNTMDQGLAVLAVHDHSGLFVLSTKAFAVADEALGAALKIEGDGAERNIGDGLKGGAQAAVDGVDAGDGFDVNLAVEVKGEVGQALGGGAQVGVATEGPIEQRRRDFGVAEQRAGGAILSGKVDFGADADDVGLVELLVGGQGDGDRARVGFAGLGGDEGVDRRVAEAVDAAAQLEGELGGEGQAGAVGDLEVLREAGDRAFGAEDGASDARGVAVGRVEGEVGRLRLTRTWRRRRGMPPKIWGSGSETAVTWAVSGSTCRAARTTTSPRS